MYTFFVSIMVIIMITLGFVTKGIIERGLWIICAVFFTSLYYRLKRKKANAYFKNYRQAILGTILGYMLILLLLLYIQYPLEESYIGQNYVDTNKTAIILVLRGEPDTYNLSLAVRNYRTNNSLWRTMLMPLAMFKEKLAYEKSSFIQGDHQGIRLEQKLKEEFGQEYNIYYTYLFNIPYLSETIYKAIQAGNQKIILCPVFLTENSEFFLIENTIQKMNLHEQKIQVHQTQPMWNSDNIARSFAKQVEDFKIGQHKYNIGIVLIGEETKRGNYNQPFLKQDLLFREKIKDYLIRGGYNNNKIRLTFFDKENINREIEKLMEYGVGEILLVPTANTLQSNSYQLRIQKIIKGIDAPYTVKIHRIDPWSFNNEIEKELINRIRLLNLY